MFVCLFVLCVCVCVCIYVLWNMFLWIMNIWIGLLQAIHVDWRTRQKDPAIRAAVYRLRDDLRPAHRQRRDHLSYQIWSVATRHQFTGSPVPSCYCLLCFFFSLSLLVLLRFPAWYCLLSRLAAIRSWWLIDASWYWLATKAPVGHFVFSWLVLSFYQFLPGFFLFVLPLSLSLSLSLSFSFSFYIYFFIWLLVLMDTNSKLIFMNHWDESIWIIRWLKRRFIVLRFPLA